MYDTSWSEILVPVKKTLTRFLAAASFSALAFSSASAMIVCLEGFNCLEFGNVRDFGSALEFMASYAGASSSAMGVVANF
jgi:hypothetical protein